MDVNESLLEAIQNSSTEIVELLLKRGADVNFVRADGRTPLHLAVAEGNQDIIRILSSNGADVNAMDRNGWGYTPLHTAVAEGNQEIIRILLSNGANVNAQAVPGTPLHIAVGKGYQEVIETLLSKGADVNVMERNGCTPLHIACRKGNPEMIRFLLSKGTDVNVEAIDGSTPLHIACQEGKKEVIEILLSNGADVNASSTINQNTPLHVAVENGCLEIIKILVSKGADVNADSIDGFTPLRIDFEEGNQDFHLGCQEELANMKIEKIIKAMNISFYDILTKNLSSLAIYMRNENIVAVLKSDNYATKFPNYFDMIKSNFRKGMERKKLLEQANQIFRVFINNFDCSDKISSFLSNQDIKNLIDAFKHLGISSPNIDNDNI